MCLEKKCFSLVLRVTPGGVGCGSEEVDAGHVWLSWQNGHHAACGTEALRVHTDPTGFVPQDAHHHLRCYRACEEGSKVNGGGK